MDSEPNRRRDVRGAAPGRRPHRHPGRLIRGRPDVCSDRIRLPDNPEALRRQGGKSEADDEDAAVKS